MIYYGSIDGIHGNPKAPAYSASRGGLIPITHIMAYLLGPEGTRVNYIAGAAISPTGHDLPKPLRTLHNTAEQIRATPLGRSATPEDMASVAVFLACEDSAYVTGAVVTADGGRTTITPGTGVWYDD